MHVRVCTDCRYKAVAENRNQTIGFREHIYSLQVYREFVSVFEVLLFSVFISVYYYNVRVLFRVVR